MLDIRCGVIKLNKHIHRPLRCSRQAPWEAWCCRCATPGPIRVLGPMNLNVQNENGQSCTKFLLL